MRINKHDKVVPETGDEYVALVIAYYEEIEGTFRRGVLTPDAERFHRLRCVSGPLGACLGNELRQIFTDVTGDEAPYWVADCYEGIRPMGLRAIEAVAPFREMVDVNA